MTQSQSIGAIAQALVAAHAEMPAVVTYRCSKCRTHKSEHCFDRDKSRPHGRAYACKDCRMVSSRGRYSKNLEASKQRHALYYAKNKAKRFQYHRAYVLNNNHKIQAQVKVRLAVRKGALIKRPCEVCGTLKVHAHHDDYSKPLEVKWLCARHHKMIHWKQPQ